VGKVKGGHRTQALMSPRVNSGDSPFRRRNQGEQMSDFEIAEARSVSEQVHRQRIGQLLGN